MAVKKGKKVSKLSAKKLGSAKTLHKSKFLRAEKF